MKRESWKDDDRTRATVDVEVRYAETDQMGVVHHANYVIWFELARTALCQKSGYHYSEIEALGYFLIVTRVEVRYGRSALYGQTVQVDCWLESLTSRGLRFAYQVRHGDQPLASGATEHLWCVAATGKTCRTPEVLREPFARLAGAS